MAGRECPNCGAPLSPKALACRECGSDARTGWAEDAETSMHGESGTLDEREYEEFLARELGHALPARARWRRRLWTLAAVGALLAFLAWAVSACRAGAAEGDESAVRDPAPSGAVMPFAHHLHLGYGLWPTLWMRGISWGMSDAFRDTFLLPALETAWIRPPFSFDEAIPSWNVKVPDGGGFVVQLRARTLDARSITPWLTVGEDGAVPLFQRVTEFEGGEIAIDCLVSRQRFDELRLRFGFADARAAGESEVKSWAIVFSDRTGATPATSDGGPEPPCELWQRRLAVPFRSQRAEDPAISDRICSPTSVAMVLAYRGIDVPTGLVADRVLDPVHDIFGNWPSNVQGAFSLGVPGYVTRFNDWRAVRRCIAEGQPLIASITARPGELSGSPYESTEGHLLVITGFDERGDVLVNDPAAKTAESGLLAYDRDELEAVWMRKGGTAYVLLPAKADE